MRVWKKRGKKLINNYLPDNDMFTVGHQSKNEKYQIRISWRYYKTTCISFSFIIFRRWSIFSVIDARTVNFTWQFHCFMWNIKWILYFKRIICVPNNNGTIERACCMIPMQTTGFTYTRRTRNFAMTRYCGKFYVAFFNRFKMTYANKVRSINY